MHSATATQPVISIVGATATGKTALALKIAASNLTSGRFQTIHLLSADSRQVYQGLETLTGADIPAGWTKQQLPNFHLPVFSNPDSHIYLHGVSVIEADREWSVAHFTKLYQALRQQLTENEQLIIVGGSGTYQKQLQGEFDSLRVPPDPQLRSQLEQLSVGQLQQQLQAFNPTRFAAMNHSDAHNPRRLIRAIEIARQIESAAEQGEPTVPATSTTPVPIIYLEPPQFDLAQAIQQRVAARFPQAVQELQTLLAGRQLDLNQLPNWQSLSSTGVKELLAYLRGEIDQQTCLEHWTRTELHYAKTQQLYTNKHVLY